MKKAINFVLKNGFVIFLVIVMLIGGGIYSAQSIKMEAMPNINIPVVTAVTVYPGASPEDISEKITSPMQKAISGLQGISDVKTINNENVGIIVAEFSYSKDMDKAEKEVNDAVNKVTMPDNAQKPTVSRIGFGSMPIMTYTVTGEKDKQKLTEYLNDKVNPKLSGINGVSSISAQGTSSNNLYIKVNKDKLKDKGVSIDDVKNALTGNNISFPVGEADIDGLTMPIRSEAKINNIDELKAIPIVVPINANAVMADTMGSALGQVSQGMEQMAQGFTQGMTQLGQGVGQMGTLVGGNTQAIAMLNGMQKIQMGILAQQSILQNPKATQAEKAQAQAVIGSLQTSLKQTQDALDKSINDTIDKSKSMASSSAQSQSGSKSNSNKSTKATTTKTPEINVKVVFLSDVAEITTTSAENQMRTRSNQKDAIILNIYKTDDANTVQVANDIKSSIKDLESQNSGVKFNLISDSSTSIKNSVNGMVREGLLGALFAIIVIAFFLRDLRATLIAVVSIPLSILIALILLPRFGISLNIMSLGGMAVAVGRIVDDSIVVIENIYRRFSKEEHRDSNLITDAVSEVSSAITSSTITTIAVFLPLTFISGMVGKIFFPFAITVVVCILASLLVSITVVPVLTKVMLLNKKIKHVEHESKITLVYKNILALALNHRVVTLIISLVVLVGTLSFASKLPVQFLPSESTNIVNGTLTMKPGASTQKTDEVAMKFEKYLSERKDIETFESSVGDSSSSSRAMSMQGSNSAKFTIVIKDGENFEKVTSELQEEAKKLSSEGGKLVVSSQSLAGQSDNAEVLVYSDKVEDLEKASKLITGKLRDFKDLGNVTSSIEEKKPEINVKVDEKKAADNGLSSIMVAGTVRNTLSSNKVTTIKNNGTDTDIYLGYEEVKLDSVDKVKNMDITGMKGTIKLSDVAEVTQSYGPSSVSTLDGKQYISITGEIKTKDTSKVSREVMAAVDSIKDQLPEGVTYNSGGSSKQINESFSQMGMAMAIAIGLVYLVMVLAFGEGKTPFAILFSLPFAAVGALLGLLITGQSLSVSGMIGMLMLIGIVVTNAIVLLDRVKHNRENGMKVKEALMEAGSIRLRPIFMTAIATIMALIPLALGFSEGALISQGLGIVVISGLLVSTLLTLIVVPVMYSILQREKL
ncbi:efflux RND transporter permease subunit [Clostridium sp. YIM B02505]|uniref:Efflux RND transporter permease subunit n=1 Tax=Clostridium yunnanense TaxID=2800325 RepID=A0ABS1EQ63_9CLOT|nr:efflux RND transporter permease subunit [Clostridium yunnanense]MBK1811496.1 efflux RND transporter permease subunit [Clostridium yunnanense]